MLKTIGNGVGGEACTVQIISCTSEWGLRKESGFPAKIVALTYQLYQVHGYHPAPAIE